MQATAEMAMGSGFRRNSVSELKLKNRCTGSTKSLIPKYLIPSLSLLYTVI